MKDENRKFILDVVATIKSNCLASQAPVLRDVASILQSVWGRETFAAAMDGKSNVSVPNPIDLDADLGVITYLKMCEDRLKEIHRDDDIVRSDKLSRVIHLVVRARQQLIAQVIDNGKFVLFGATKRIAKKDLAMRICKHLNYTCECANAECPQLGVIGTTCCQYYELAEWINNGFEDSSTE